MLRVRDFSNYKFRPHAVGKLMKGLPKPLTQNQTETLIALEEKYSNQKITEKQLETLVDLRKKQKAKPVLSEGAKTYLKSIFKEEVFGRKKEVQNKYLTKGIAVEDENINLYNEVNGTFLIKNEVRYENEFFTGEMDIEEDDEIIDFKSSWDYSTFPLFEDDVPNEDYEDQLLAYMDLRPNVKSAKLVYGLVDTPVDLILDEKRRIGWKLGLIDGLPEDLDEEITRNMTYADIPKEARIKKFIIYRDEKRIDQIKAMILLAREYLNSLNTTLAKHLQLI
ncbi:uncharacterized protein CHSO_1057 [Chryseobacterium sp. StRB126]|uniref:hypothetical protein n=1 Tax=Chryseobacterium sp. StRB126 TaxID=878220 RepID=UPI0004E9938B|nr:hypothetical protein [Chryseobacterium sp. StRB126]BAP30094.1 uncharacterized protein CHSO_1057 [Chryseobacterium sp. StRB126]